MTGISQQATIITKILFIYDKLQKELKENGCLDKDKMQDIIIDNIKDFSAEDFKRVTLIYFAEKIRLLI